MGGIDYEEIQRRISHCRFTDHARREMDAEPLGKIQLEELLQALDSGEVIEEYPEDTPYPSCLILGHTASGRPLHVVVAPVPNGESLIIITTYQPDPNLTPIGGSQILGGEAADAMCDV